MITKSDRAKQAFNRGVEAAKAGKTLDDNYYKYMGALGRYLAGHWEQGYCSNQTKNGKLK